MSDCGYKLENLWTEMVSGFKFQVSGILGFLGFLGGLGVLGGFKIGQR